MQDFSVTPGYSGHTFYVKCPDCLRVLQKTAVNPYTARVTCDHCKSKFLAYHHIQEVEE